MKSQFLQGRRRTLTPIHKFLCCCVLMGAGSLAAPAATFLEDFSTPPAASGWSVVGQTNLFGWDPTHHWLTVTWDSAQSNSFFRRPLGTILAKNDDFTLGFDLYLLEATIGVNPEKPYSFEVALGFHNSLQAVRPEFQRGRGVGASPNLVEFDYFPEYYNPGDIFSHQATVWPTFTSTNGAFNYDGASSYREIALPTHCWLRVLMQYTAADRQLTTTLRTNAAPFLTGQEGAILLQFNTRLTPSFTDFRVDTFAVASYSDDGAGGSLLARGYVDNVHWTVPDPPLSPLLVGSTNGLWRAGMNTLPGWLYQLQFTTNWLTWSPASAQVPGAGTWQWLTATNPQAGAVFYRATAIRP